MGLLCCLTLSLNSTTPAKMQLLRWVVLAPQNPTWSQSRAAMCYVLLQSQAGNVRVAAAASALGASTVSAAAAGGGPGPFLEQAHSICHCTLRCMHVIARSAITQTKYCDMKFTAGKNLALGRAFGFALASAALCKFPY